MVRNFVTGILWGGVLAVGGLAVVSQIAPPGGEAPMPEAEAPVKSEPVVVAENPEPAAVVPEVQPEGAEAPQGLTKAPEDSDEPLLRPMAEAEAPPPASVVPDMQAPVTGAEVPKTEAAPAPAPEDVAEPVKPEDAPKPETTAEPAPAAEKPVEPAPAEPASAAPQVGVEPEPAAEPASEAVPEPAPAAEPAPQPAPAVEPSPDSAPAPEPAPTETAEAPAATLTPDGSLTEKTVEGVTTGRLPSIGAPAEAPAEEPAAAPAPDADLPPVQRFARSFENPDAKPLFAILLIDPGTPEVKRAELAALPFPVSFVLDPMAPGAAEAAAIYRAAGQEVVMLATGIPKGAKASDLEQSFAGLQGALPEAVALIDTAEAIFQDDRGLAAEVVTLLADQGRGLVTFDRGLNAADQVARREGLPAATIFRSLDDDGEDAPLIRRYLDRAAFKAAQEGRVVVIGTARDETIAALMEWAVEGRSASVALAPITAIMTTQ